MFDCQLVNKIQNTNRSYPKKDNQLSKIGLSRTQFILHAKVDATGILMRPTISTCCFNCDARKFALFSQLHKVRTRLKFVLNKGLHNNGIM